MHLKQFLYNSVKILKRFDFFGCIEFEIRNITRFRKQNNLNRLLFSIHTENVVSVPAILQTINLAMTYKKE